MVEGDDEIEHRSVLVFSLDSNRSLHFDCILSAFGRSWTSVVLTHL